MWLDGDYEVALMWQQEQDLECPGCGQPRDEVWVFDPDEQHAKAAAWKAGLRKCVACDHVERRDHRYRQNEHRDKFGIHPTVERVEGAPPRPD